MIRLLASAIAVGIFAPGLLGCETTPEEAPVDPLRDESISRFDRLSNVRNAIAQDPDDAGLHYLHGNLLFDLGMYGDAANAYQMATRHAPDMAKAFTNLGLALRHLGRNAEAVQAYRRALRIDPDDQVTWRNMLVAAEVRGDQATVQQCLEELAALDPGTPQVWAELGAFLRDQGNPSGAAEAYAKLCELESDVSENHFLLGLCYYETQRYAECALAWERVLRIEPSHDLACKSLVAAYWRMGSLDQARAAAERCRARGISLPDSLREAIAR